MKTNKWLLIRTIAFPLLVGAIAGLLTRNAMQDFDALKQPPLSPPGWLFPIVWTILYTLMGISAYIIKMSEASAEQIDDILMIYRYQLIVNFLWSIFFFNFEWYFFSFIWILLLWVLIILMIRSFSSISKTAAYLNIPYLLWVTFAAYLNFGVWWLNR